MTFMEWASLRSECRRLTRFLRLVDFIGIDTLKELILDSVEEAVSAVGYRDACCVVGPNDAPVTAGVAPPPKPLFCATVDIDESAPVDDVEVLEERSIDEEEEEEDEDEDGGEGRGQGHS